MKRLKLLCMNDKMQFRLVEGRYSLYYQCPKYNYDSRLENENACHNHLTCLEAEEIKKMVTNNKQYILEDTAFEFKNFIIKTKEDSDNINIYVRRK